MISEVDGVTICWIEYGEVAKSNGNGSSVAVSRKFDSSSDDREGISIMVV